MKRSRKSEAGGPKIEKNGDRGCRQEATKREVEKIGVVLNYPVPFLLIFVKNGSQDGDPNPVKVD